MNRDDIIRMAREAGLLDGPVFAQGLERFAALVAESEREACAKVVENHALGYAEPVWAFKLIDTIRARGQA